MTREEAIEQIYNIEYGHKVSNDDLIAFGLALEALAGLQPTCNQLATDCISRQDFDKFLGDAEKEAVKNSKYVFASALNTIRGNLRNFPSVQPETHDKRTETHACDTISRQAAIDALVKAIREDPYYDSNEAINGLGVCDVRVILNDLPSVQPEIIRCKDCRKHNVNAGYKEDCCPLYEWRGVSYGHEHDNQYCFAGRRTDETN